MRHSPPVTGHKAEARRRTLPEVSDNPLVQRRSAGRESATRTMDVSGCAVPTAVWPKRLRDVYVKHSARRRRCTRACPRRVGLTVNLGVNPRAQCVHKRTAHTAGTIETGQMGTAEALTDRQTAEAGTNGVMKALVYQGPGHRASETKPRPTIRDRGDAIVRITRSTICVTDLHVLKGNVPSVTAGRISDTRAWASSSRSVQASPPFIQGICCSSPASRLAASAISAGGAMPSHV
jgi:hypothetical protein